ncbi:MAG: hypothetical protein Q7R50_03365 [Dehalococcoidales bacterium]|nr:hypothetical protein [Dehalococcoidales bacterium]
MKKRIAVLISNILNPFLVGLAVILILSFSATTRSGDALKWTLVASGLSILPIFVVVIYLLRTKRLNSFFLDMRQQRTNIYVLSGACGIAGCLLLAFLKAPMMLIAGFIASLLITLIFMCINFWWKISLHTAFIAGSATLLVILYGWMGTLVIPLIPVTAWARAELKSHSWAQATTGAVLAAAIVAAVFYPLVVA